MKKTKKIFLLMFVILLLSLTSCQMKEEDIEEPMQVIEEVINYGEYAYKSVVADCEVDNDSSCLICLDEENNDYKNVDSFMDTYGEDGWELVDIMKGGEGKYLFVMKRAK